MTQQQPQNWKAPTVPLSQVLLTALGQSFVAAAVLSVLYFVVRYIALLSRADAGAPPFGEAGSLFFVVWCVGFAGLLIFSTRVWLDYAFTVSGFFATFFGLAILVIFFIQLGNEVVHWYQYTPMLVDLENQRLQTKLARLQEAKQEALAKLERERDETVFAATTEEEKKELRDEFALVIKQEAEIIDKNQAEDKIIIERSIRPSTTGVGSFWSFLISSPNSEPQEAGIGPALWGSIWLSLITIVFSVPIGVGAALYLEEYRQEGWLAKIIQVNINNLAGVPSVVYGILGGFVFVYFFKIVKQYEPGIDEFNLLGGGLTLGLLTLPMVIVSSQEAIRAVPSSLRQGAYALGATKWQVMWTIVLPMARPGILTGTILSLSRAIGEAAPLVLFGAQQYVDRYPSLFKPFTALPLQIFNWCSRTEVLVNGPEGELKIDIWKYNAAVASCVLLIVLLTLNAVAIILRNRAQRRMRY